LNEIGFDGTIDLSRKLGITSDLRAYLSLGLGAFEITLMELTSAYGTFANGGVHVEPHLVREVRDHGGNVLLRYEPAVQDAVRPEIAYLMNRSLEGVITDGTGRAAAFLDRPLAGKTGTTDDFTDAWFVGYAPDLVVGVWVGFDVKKTLGSRETGAQAALPIWSQFMKSALESRPVRDFPRPEGLTLVSIDRETGLRANPRAGCESVVVEAFVSGTEPTELCTRAHHRRLAMPYPLQRFPINERGELEISSDDLDRLLATDLSLMLSPSGQEIIAFTSHGRLSMDIALVPGSTASPLPPRVLERFDPATWTGKDGRPATVEMVRR
jgi:membrane carboxypeptidase/penicillin-binding protein